MWSVSELVIAFLIASVTTVLVTPVVIKLSKKLNAVDRPDSNRKIHNGIKPSMGGIAIFIGVAAGFLYLQPVHEHMHAIIIGAVIMLLTGVLDDIFEFKALYKLIGQISAALVVVSSGLLIEKLTIPFMGTVYLGSFSIFITIFWILAASNAINLIDGLDGLAAGVSAIAFSSILVMALVDYRIIVVYLSVILIGSCIGFLFHNFHPSKIFMGDTGALFLGYAIAIVSMLGLFKNVALFSFIIPIIVIAIPVFDTIYAIIRRAVNNQGIATGDKYHIHYLLLEMGYTHRQSVLIIYAFSIFFGCMAVIFNSATLLTSLFILIAIVLAIQLIAEIAGIPYFQHQTLLNGIRKVAGVRKD